MPYDKKCRLTVVNEQELAILGINKNSIFPLALIVNMSAIVEGAFLKFSDSSKE